MAQRNVICIVVDRLHAGTLGAYGNSWIRTAALDRLAAESFVFDQAYLDSTHLSELCRGYWLGQHVAQKQPAPGASQSQLIASLPQLLADAGVHTALVTDDAEVAALELADAFAEKSVVAVRETKTAASDVARTGMARVFAAATTWLAKTQPPFCLWVHLRGMGGPWDAPPALRNRFAEEDDPTPPDFVAMPDYWLPDEHDPDEVLGIKHAYAGQVAALDACLGAFCEQFDASALAANTQLTLLSARGFPLGEHRRIGPCDGALYNETTQLAWLMRFPDARGKLARSQALVQPFDLPGTLLDWLELDRSALGAGKAASLLGIIDGAVAMLRDRAIMISQHDRAIRTPGWHLRAPVTGAVELYAKPGDRWEVNEVANREREVAAGLEAALAEIVAAGEVDQLPPLAESLATAID